MEGQDEKVEQGIQEVNTPEFVDVSQEAPEEPEEDYPEGEEYAEGDYPEGEDYSEGEYEDDEDWESETGGSEPAPLGGIYGLFKDVLKKPDSKKVSNLTKEELGLWNLSVRDCERIALIAETFHHQGVANFFIKQSRIITDTAMSRGGWFTELFITSKRYASRDSSSSVSNLPQFNKKSKWRVFSEKENPPAQEQPQ